MGRQSGCSTSVETATEASPGIPETEPDQDLGAGAVLPGAQHDDHAAEHREDRAGHAEPDRERREEHQQQPDGRGDGDQDLVGDPGVGADPVRVDLAGSAVMSAVE